MNEIIKKVCLFGDGGVGKTSLIQRFVKGSFDEKYLSTLGTVISKKELTSSKTNYKINLQIWDISGQAEFKRIHASGFKGAAGGLAVCDVTEPETVKNLKTWFDNFKKYTRDDIPIIILINKSDLVKNDFDSAVVVNELIDQYDYHVYHTSALSGLNVENAFRNLGSEMATTVSSIKGPLWEDAELDKVLRTPGEFLDYISVRFCNVISDFDGGMQTVRNIVEEEGIDFHNVTKKETSTVMKRLLNEVMKMKDMQVMIGLQQDFLIAHTQCKNDAYPKAVKNT